MKMRKPPTQAKITVRLEDGTETTLNALAEKVVKDQDDRLKAINKNLPPKPAPGEVITIKGGRFALQRERDGAGDSGPMLVPFDWDERKAAGENGTIQVGYGVKCGSIYARTMQAQDFWLTTPITEILERGETEEGSWVKFKTGNSVYTVKGF